jgi:hypothetical protein
MTVAANALNAVGLVLLSHAYGYRSRIASIANADP